MRADRELTPLHEHLIALARAALLERGIGTVKLAKLTGIDRRNLQRTLKGDRSHMMSGWTLIRILYALGYKTEFTICERELTDAEREYFPAKGRGNTYHGTLPTNEEVSHALSVRRMAFTGRTRSRSEKAIIAATSDHARRYREALEKEARSTH